MPSSSAPLTTSSSAPSPALVPGRSAAARDPWPSARCRPSPGPRAAGRARAGCPAAALRWDAGRASRTVRGPPRQPSACAGSRPSHPRAVPCAEPPWHLILPRCSPGALPTGCPPAAGEWLRALGYCWCGEHPTPSPSDDRVARTARGSRRLGHPVWANAHRVTDSSTSAGRCAPATPIPRRCCPSCAPTESRTSSTAARRPPTRRLVARLQPQIVYHQAGTEDEAAGTAAGWFDSGVSFAPRR